ncbi:MAG: ABC transporter substrate-binding protein [Dehalococcoidia bacterium]
MAGNYWTRTRIGRRGVIRGAGLGFTGLAAAALVGCGGDEDGDATATAGTGGLAGSTPPPTVTQAAIAGDTPVPADQVRITPGIYEGPIPPTAAELNPGVNAKRGGTLAGRYLDPPRMDLARTLSCTIYHTLTYTSNKLTRAQLGANADPFRINIEPDLAESWEITEGGQKHTFKLRQGAKFHNKAPVSGREFTAEDVVKTVEMYSEGSQADVFSMVESMETPDDYTIVFNLDQPLNDFPLNVAAWSFIYPRELVDDTELRQEVSIGTGPFTQEEWIKAERSTFKANPDYWEKDNAGNQLPYLDGVIAFVQNDTSAQRSGFSTDNYFHMEGRDTADLESMFGERGDTMVSQTTPVSRGANVNGFQFQMTNPTYQDERVRRAVSLAFDRDEFDLARYNGDNASPEGAYSQSPLPWPLLYDTYPTRAANGPWYQFNPAEASKMMQAAGYTADNPLTAECISWYNRTEFAQLAIPGISQNLPEIDITFREVDNPTHVTLMSDRNFAEMIGFLWGPPGYSMDQWLYPFYHSAGSLNYGSINDSALDDLLVAQRREADPAAQKALWQQISDHVHDQVYQAWWPVGFQRAVWHNYVMNHRGHGWAGTWGCYSSDQARSIWLDDGAAMRS